MSTRVALYARESPLQTASRIPRCSFGSDNIDITAHYAQVSTRLMMRAYSQAHPHAGRAHAEPCQQEVDGE